MKKSTTAQPSPRWKRSLLSLAVGAALCTPMAAMAVEFELKDGEVTGSFDSTVSYGALWRVTAPDAENIAKGNGGSKQSSNFDNGTLAYDRGDLVSSLFKLSNDLELNYQNFSGFLRVLSFYDHSIQNKDFNDNRTDVRVLNNRIGHDYEILDAYLSGTFKVAEKSLNVRLGKQVISWGESTFLGNGINVINPVDVSKLRAPGAELKEGFLPVNMISLSQEITDNITVEAFNQFEHKKTRIEPYGSYFSTNDFLSPGASFANLNGGQSDAMGTQAKLARAPDKNVKDRNQHGVAVRFLLPNQNNSEVSAYYVNYHSRTPFLSGTTGTGGGGGGATYNGEFPEDIALYGLSFNTLGPLGIALQGEYSYRPKMPVQLSAINLLTELLTNGTANIPNSGVGNANNAALTPGTNLPGFKRVEFHQAQLTATHTLGPRIGANQVVAVVEAGYTYQRLPNGMAFNAAGTDFSSPTPGATGFQTNNSYGYRAVISAAYLNAIGPVNLTPRLAFSHDLRGVSATFNQGVKAASVGVNATYQSNIQADVSYTNFFGGENYNVTGGLGPTSTTNNPLSDRDFIAATVSYSF